MPQGSKAKYTAKQKRKAEHIADSYKEKGLSSEEADARAWATVNKQSGGGERSGGGGQQKSSASKERDRKESAREAAATRQGRSLQARLERKTKDELLHQARKKNIRGRSKMRKQELISALKKIS